MIKLNLKNNKGYTLLFAVIVSSIVLSVGISIMTISKKEFLLASSARDSISAFYASDSALECAIFSDNISTSSPDGNQIKCMNQDITAVLSYLNPGDTTSKASFNFDIRIGGVNSKLCAKVLIEKYYENDQETGSSVAGTTITSRGYNVGWNSYDNTCTINSPNRVERAIFYKF